MQDSARAGTAWPAVLAATLCGIVVAMNIGKLPIALPQLRGKRRSLHDPSRCNLTPKSQGSSPSREVW